MSRKNLLYINFMNSIYSIKHNKFIDKIVIEKRLEISKIINAYIQKFSLNDALDIGTTNDFGYESSNLLIKNLKNIKIFKSISDQKINSKFFTKSLNQSITVNLSKENIMNYSSDIVISNATIEHVGNLENQIKMIENIINLTNKIFVITTPNKFFPIEFHTKLPFVHWFPKSIHRKILNLIGMNFFSKEENLNLLSKNDLINMLNNFKKKIKYKILHINLLGIKSNFIIIGEIIK